MSLRITAPPNCQICGAAFTKNNVVLLGSLKNPQFVCKNCKETGAVKKNKKAAIAAKSGGAAERDISKTIADDLGFTAPFSTRLQSGELFIDYTVKSGEKRIRKIKLCEPGTPDRFFCDGLPVFLEIKQPGKSRTAEQIAINQILTENGGLCFEVSSFEDYSLIRRLMKNHAPQINRIKAEIAKLQKTIETVLNSDKEK